MPRKKFNRGHAVTKPGRDTNLINKLRKDCVKGYRDEIEREREQRQYKRLKDVPVEHPPHFGEPVRIIQGKEFGPKL